MPDEKNNFSAESSPGAGQFSGELGTIFRLIPKDGSGKTKILYFYKKKLPDQVIAIIKRMVPEYIAQGHTIDYALECVMRSLGFTIGIDYQFLTFDCDIPF
jgi:hypothetical protein